MTDYSETLKTWITKSLSMLCDPGNKYSKTRIENTVRILELINLQAVLVFGERGSARIKGAYNFLLKLKRSDDVMQMLKELDTLLPPE